MKQIRNILVALDLSNIDAKVVEYSSVMAEKLNAENVYFAHNIKKNQLSDLFKEQMRDIDIEAIVESRIEKTVKKSFRANTHTEILISEDSDTVSLLQYVARKFAIDLVVVGNKNHKEGAGVVSAKLLHSLSCDILSVNSEAALPTGNFMCTTDFSKNSSSAINKAINIAGLFDERKITCLNVYKIPQLFFPYLDREESMKKVLKHTKSKFEKFLKNFRNKEEVTALIESAGELSIPRKIKEIAVKNKFELMFVSGKGQNSFNTLLVGSVTESLFTRKTYCPLWIVR